MKPKLPTEITLSPGDTITWSQYTKHKARQLTEKHRASKVTFTPDLISSLAVICQTSQELPDETPSAILQGLEEICCDLEKSKEYESMTPEPVEEQIEEETETLGNTLLEMGKEPVIESEVTPVEPVREVNSQEALIVQRAMSVGREMSMEQTKAYLEERFDLGDGNTLKSKPGVTVKAADFGAALMYGSRLEQAGSWLCGDAINMLNSLGYENAVIQIASSIGKSASTVYNYARTAKLIQDDMRDQSIPITVYSELVNRRYDEDEAKNVEIITELANQAISEKWSCNEARSHADERQGKEPKEKVQKYRYLVTLPGLQPYLTMTQPGYSVGVQVVDLKTMEYLRDLDNKIEFVPVVKEPTDEQIREMKEAQK